MHPSIWGPDIWRAMHYVALGYPEKDVSIETRDAYTSFFLALGPVLPCGLCSKHYQDHLVQQPVGLALIGRDALFRWTVDIHNFVSVSTGKPVWTYEQAYDEYAGANAKAKSLARSKNPSDLLGNSTQSFVIKVVIWMLLILGLVALLMWLRSKKRTFLHRT